MNITVDSRRFEQLRKQMEQSQRLDAESLRLKKMSLQIIDEILGAKKVAPVSSKKKRLSISEREIKYL